MQHQKCTNSSTEDKMIVFATQKLEEGREFTTVQYRIYLRISNNEALADRMVNCQTIHEQKLVSYVINALLLGTEQNKPLQRHLPFTLPQKQY